MLDVMDMLNVQSVLNVPMALPTINVLVTRYQVLAILRTNGSKCMGAWLFYL